MTAREDVAASRQRLFALPTINALKGVAWPHRGDRGVMVAAGERDPCFNAGQSGQAAALRPLRALTGIDGIRIDLTTAPWRHPIQAPRSTTSMSNNSETGR
ncbi:MAG: hypothetical protein IIA03_07665 [Proteobacteria bacterium]|nr:hypothetical protein [Burkholderiaceae bacterium]MCH8856101.1 hypothetical protein [Pseudomonadota bacterium]